MRKLLGAVLVALLIPTVLAAQKPATAGEEIGRKVPVFITASQAQTAALARVRGDLAAGKLNAWGGGTGGGIRPANLVAQGALFNLTGGKSVYVIGVTSPNTGGHVRVIVDAKSGAVVDTKVSSFQWGVTAPDWWVKGLNSPPPAKSN